MKKLPAFEKASQKLIDKFHIPGSIVAVAQEGSIHYSKTFGSRNVAEELPVTLDTVFGLASITKSFTCVAIMQLQEKGLLHVHDPVSIYLPELQLKNNTDLTKITIHHFMTHSSGIPPLPFLDDAMLKVANKGHYLNNVEEVNKKQIKTYGQLIQAINEVEIELFATPGTKFSYSNDAYALLGIIIERVSGKSYEDYIYDHITMPCGMNHSYFTTAEYEDYDNISMCYEKDDQDNSIFPTDYWWDAPAMRAAGFLKSTANDMLAYTEIFKNNGLVGNNRILTADSVKEMLTPHIKIHHGKFYGYGLGVTPDYFGQTLIEHGGSLPAVSAKVYILPEQNVSTITLTNLMDFPATRLMDYVMNAYYGRDIDAELYHYPEVHIDPMTLELYKGDYKSDEGMEITIAEKNDQLFFHYKGSETPIKFIQEHVFLVSLNDVTEVIEILIDDSGHPTGISCFFRIIPKQ